MITAEKSSCSLPGGDEVYLECVLPAAGPVELWTMLATVAAVLVSLGIAVLGPIISGRSAERIENRKTWDESSKVYVEALRGYLKAIRKLIDKLTISITQPLITTQRLGF